MPSSLFNVVETIWVRAVSYATGPVRMGRTEFLRCLPGGSFPNHPIVVTDALDLSNDSYELPKNLTFESDVDFGGCTSLKALSEGLQVGRNLILSDCTSLTSLPEGLRVGGDLDLRDCGSLRALPVGLHVGGDLDLSGCTSLRTLPEGLHVGGNLDLRHFGSLTSLPEGLYVRGDLHLNYCRSLTSLPEGLQVGGHLYLRGCTSLISMPEGLQVGGHLDLGGCTSLTTLSEGLQVGEELNLRDCTSLTVLPDGLHVGGDLYLWHCRSLTSLPDGLHVGGELDPRGCTSLTSLPEGLQVGGNLTLADCTSLRALPNNITEWGPTANGETREVDLEGTGLSDALIDRLRATEAPGMRFVFSRQVAPITEEFTTVANAVKFWSALLPRGELSPISLSLRSDQNVELVRFLTRLKSTAEYKNLAARPTLAKRINDVLKKMQGSDAFKETACLIIHEGLSTCHDRIISALDELDLMVQINKAEERGERKELRKLARGMLMLEEVQKAAGVYARTLTWVDEIEIQLAFQIGLRERLRLPLSTGHMIFRGCAHVSDERIQRVGAGIERNITDAKVETYLRTWSPWKKLLRREAFDKLKPELVEAPAELEWVCCLTSEDLTEGYLYEGHLYDPPSLRKCYVEKASDPFTNLPMDLALVKRVVKRGPFYRGAFPSSSTDTAQRGDPVQPKKSEAAEEPLRLGSTEFLRRLRSGSFPNQPIVLTDDLRLDDSYDLTKLPKNLKVESDLYFIDCTSLTALPEGLYVGLSLYLRGCASLTTLPEGLQVGKSLSLQGCRSLSALPEGLQVGGGLYLRDCRSLRALPEGLQVGGGLYLRDCRSLRALPEGLHVGGNLDLRGCTSLRALPEGLQVGGALLLNFSTLLSALPDESDLMLGHCTSLTSLPAGLQVGGRLSLWGCRSLTALPEGLQIGGDLDLSDCTSLTALPKGLHVGGNLDLRGCTFLRELPAGLHVGGNLDLRGCTSLTALPVGLLMGGHLVLEGCTSLTTLPEGLQVGGGLWLNDCTSLTALPSDITEWGPSSNGRTREVTLTGTGLSDALIDRLRATEAPGMHFVFSRQATPITEEFATVAEAVNFWGALLPRGGLSPISLSLRFDQETDVMRFLTRLKGTAEYKNLAARPTLAKRINDVLKKMQGNDEFKETACLIIHEGLSTCHDRIIGALDELDLMVQIHKAEERGERNELRKLARGMLLLEEVQKAAEVYARTLTWVDEIEIQLAFQIGLRERLRLPLSTGHMSYRGCAHVSDERIQQVGAGIERNITDAKVETYLRTWSPWKKLLRREAFNKLKPELMEAPVEMEWLCCLTSEDLTEGYLYEGHLYDPASLRKCYVEKASDPFTNLPIDLTFVKRVVKRGPFYRGALPSSSMDTAQCGDPVQPKKSEAAEEPLRLGSTEFLRRLTSGSLPNQSIVVTSSLPINDSYDLTKLPKNLTVESYLDLSGCPSLTALPEGLKVGKDLYLSGCPSLTALPEGLKVGGNLYLSGCMSLTALPEGLKVGGNLYLSGCTSLTLLPNHITQCGPRADGRTRTVDLANTGLSHALIDRLRRQEAPGMWFLFST